MPSEGRTDATKRARQAEVETPQESTVNGGASGSSAEADVDLRMVHAGKDRWIQAGDKDMVCGLDVCDELDELDENSFSDTYVNDREGDYTDEVTRVTLLRDDVAKARMEEMKRYEKFQAFDEVPDEACVLRTGRKPIPCRWRVINEGDSERVEVRSRLVAREIKQKGTDSYFAGTPPLALVRYVTSKAATLSKSGKRRQLTVLDAKRAFLHDRDVCETATLTRHRTMLVVEEMHVWHTSCSNTSFRKLVQTLACSAQAIVHGAFGHSARDMVVHGDDFIVAGDGDDFDWLLQILN